MENTATARSAAPAETTNDGSGQMVLVPLSDCPAGSTVRHQAAAIIVLGRAEDGPIAVLRPDGVVDTLPAPTTVLADRDRHHITTLAQTAIVTLYRQARVADDDARAARHSLAQAQRRWSSTLSAMRERIVEKYREGGSICDAGLVEFLDDFGMEPLGTEVHFTIEGHYRIRTDDQNHAEYEAENYLSVDTSDIDDVVDDSLQISITATTDS